MKLNLWYSHVEPARGKYQAYTSRPTYHIHLSESAQARFVSIAINGRVCRWMIVGQPKSVSHAFPNSSPVSYTEKTEENSGTAYPHSHFSRKRAG